MNNHGNYIVSLGNVCRWLAAKAEELEVEIYPGFAGSEVLYNDAGSVIGVGNRRYGPEPRWHPRGRTMSAAWRCSASMF